MTDCKLSMDGLTPEQWRKLWLSGAVLTKPKVEKKYYFIYYRFEDGRRVIHAQDTTSKHPIKWQIDTNEKYSDGSYLVCNWIEITRKEYKKYKDNIG